MRLSLFILSISFLAASCSSSDKQKAKATALSNELENIPFEKLHTVRVLLTIVSNKIDDKAVRQVVLEEFEKIGVVHTPEDTSLEKLMTAQAKPYAILALDIKEIESSNDEKTLPVISFSCKMYEESELMINQKKWMGNVWEKNKYVEISPNQNETAKKIIREIENVVIEFSKNYYVSNPKTIKPEFYIGKTLNK